MLQLVEEKITWNLRIFSSVARQFDALIDRSCRGEKGTACSAALAMFMAAPPELQRRFVDIIKLAEGRGLDGTVLDAARKIIQEEAARDAAEAAEILDAAEDQERSHLPGKGVRRLPRPRGESNGAA